MKFTLYLELATRAQDLRILDLLRFPLESAFASEPEWSAQWWSQGKTRRMRTRDRDKILHKIAGEGVNEL